MATGFDEHADGYEVAVERAIGFAGLEHDFYTRAKIARLVDIVRRRVGDPAQATALDVGCGPGLTCRLLSPELGSVHGVDISNGMVERARREDTSGRYEVYDGVRLPFPDESYDLTFAICVFHHVSLADQPALLREMRRVTKSRGLVLVFEHNPLNPLTRRVVRNCVFDEGVELIGRSALRSLFQTAELDVVEQAYMLFFPSDRPVLTKLERKLSAVPFGAQYLLVGTKLPPAVD